MITRNFKAVAAMWLQQSSVIYSALPVTDVNGRLYYLGEKLGFPSSLTQSFALNAATRGISVGTGSTPASENDWNLENTITSGLTVTVANMTSGVDSDGNPKITYQLSVTNTGSGAITISEIGYKQSIYGAKYPGGTAGSRVCLLDRTVLETPLTLAAGDAGTITYTLTTTAFQSKTVGGVKCVSWTYGSDADVAACISAARAGTIDLQRDCGWQIGDLRAVEVAAFTAGGNVSEAAQTAYLAISSFAEYEGCGNVVQFDFLNSLLSGVRMNATSTNAGGYGASEMYTTTLPALVLALPSWLQSLLKTFSVKASAGQQSTTIETVPGNKLALRSEVEIFGETTYSAPGEGTQVELYSRTIYRRKTFGNSGSSAYWWERSPRVSTSTYFCTVGSSGTPYTNTASTAYGVAPFGCI